MSLGEAWHLFRAVARSDRACARRRGRASRSRAGEYPSRGDEGRGLVHAARDRLRDRQDPLHGRGRPGAAKRARPRARVLSRRATRPPSSASLERAQDRGPMCTRWGSSSWEMVIGRPAIEADGDGPMAGIEATRPTPKRSRGVDVGALEAVLARALGASSGRSLSRRRRARSRDGGGCQGRMAGGDGAPSRFASWRSRLSRKSPVVMGMDVRWRHPSSHTAEATEVGMDFHGAALEPHRSHHRRARTPDVSAPPAIAPMDRGNGRSLRSCPRSAAQRACSDGAALGLSPISAFVRSRSRRSIVASPWRGSAPARRTALDYRISPRASAARSSCIKRDSRPR